jgi:hypothetical protein
VFHPVAKKETHLWFIFVLLGILAKYKVYPTDAERALAPVSPSGCGIGSIIV